LLPPRIALEVGLVVELGRVDEDARYDLVGAPLRLVDQRHVGGVERPHRRHQRPRAVTQIRQRAGQFFTGSNGLHGRRASVNLLTGRRFDAVGEEIKHDASAFHRLRQRKGRHRQVDDRCRIWF
jgi:hypothetical protein